MPTASFTAAEGQSVSAPQPLHVHLQDDKAASLWAACVAPQTPPSWLIVAITLSAPDYDVTPSVTTTSLPPRTLTATLTPGTTDASGNLLYAQAVRASLTTIQLVALDHAAISDSFVRGQPAAHGESGRKRASAYGVGSGREADAAELGYARF